MPNITTATDFLNTLNHAHPSVSFTMEIEKDGMLPFLGTQLLNCAPQIETKVYVKPTNTGLLVHYQSHVDNRYKRSLLTTMLDRAYRLSSSSPYFSEECERLKSLFSRLDYPHHLINSTITEYLCQLESCWPTTIAGFGKIGGKWCDPSSHTLQGPRLC